MNVIFEQVFVENGEKLPKSFLLKKSVNARHKYQLLIE